MLRLLFLIGDFLLLPGVFNEMKHDGHFRMFLVIRQDFSLLFLEM